MRYIFLLIISTLFISCLSDNSNKITSERLSGKWNIVSAKRNKKETRLLKSGFILFQKDTLITNINAKSDTIQKSYSIKDKIIDAEDINYNVLYNNLDTLVLSVKISKFDFELTLAKE